MCKCGIKVMLLIATYKRAFFMFNLSVNRSFFSLRLNSETGLRAGQNETFLPYRFIYTWYVYL